MVSAEARTPPPSRKGSALSHASTASAASLSSLTRIVTSQLTRVLQRPAACCGDEDHSPHRRAAGPQGKVVPTNRRRHLVTPAFGDETVPLDDEVRLPLTTYMQMLQLADECHARGGHRFVRGTEPHMVQSFLVDLEGLSDPDDVSENEWELGEEPSEVNRCRTKATRSFGQGYFVMDDLKDIKFPEAEKMQATMQEAPTVSALAPRERHDGTAPRSDRSRDRDTPPSAALTTNPLSPTSTEARNDKCTLSVPRVAARRSEEKIAGEATPRKSPSQLANKRWKAALTITRITARWPRPEMAEKQEVTSPSSAPESKRRLRRSVSSLSSMSKLSSMSRRSSVTNRTAVSLPSRNSMATISSMPSNTSEQLPRHRDLQRSRIKGRRLKHNFQQDGEFFPSEGTPHSIREVEDFGEWERTPRGERTPGGSLTPGPNEFQGRGDYSRQGSFVPSLSGEQPAECASPGDGFGRLAADSPAQTPPPGP